MKLVVLVCCLALWVGGAMASAGSIDSSAPTSDADDRIVHMDGASGVPTQFEWSVDPECRGCDVCGAGEGFHVLYESGIRDAAPGDDHVGDCWSTGTCDEWHPPLCEMTSAAASELQALWDGLATGIQVGELARRVDDLGELVHVDQDRQALQVVGCEGKIVAHIPLSTADFDALISVL
jgi:hypothetical protein